MSRILVVLSAASFCMTASSVGQTLERNPQGDYVLRYTDLNDTVRTVVVQATDQVQASLTLQVSSSGGSLVYRYVLANGPTARRAVALVDIPCPATDPTLAATGPPSWNAKAEASGRLDGVEGLKLCSYSFRDEGAVVMTGTLLSYLQITSTWLPAVRTARAYGMIETVLMPTVREDTPDTVYILVERAQGFGFFTGGGLAVPSVAPARSPAALANAPAALDSVGVDLSQSCSLGWIANPGVCTDLGGRLDQARQALGQGDASGARARLEGFLAELGAQFGPGLPVNDNAFWLLKTNAEFVLGRLAPPSETIATLYLHGSGGTANPPTLSLSTVAPTTTTEKYKDSPAIKFSGGNAWVQVGTWTAAPAVSSGTLTALGDAHVWLGLKNSDDIGTRFDLRVEAYKNGTLVGSGETSCIQGVTRNPTSAKEVTVSFGTVSSTPFNGTTDVLSFKVLNRIGTNGAGAFCGGHSNAVGVRLYFDSPNRAARFSGTF